MQERPLKYNWIRCFGIVLLLFAVVNLVGFPLFNSGDDVFLLYQVSGGFGDPPSNLLQYDHIWHPLLGRILAFGFHHFPRVNWYGLALLLFQLKACTVLLYVFSRRFRPAGAFLFFGLFFCLVEIRALLSLQFTFTAWMLALAGMLLLHQSLIAGGKTERVNSLFAILLLLLAGLLRLQVAGAVVLLFIPVMWVHTREKFRIWGTVILLLAALLFGANRGQKRYYREKITGWEQAERYRQSLFHAYNRTLTREKPGLTVFRDSTERALYGSQFFYDTVYFSRERVKEIGKQISRYRDFREPEDREVLHWLYIGWRIYLWLFFIVFFLFWQQGIGRTVFRRWWLPAGITIGFYIYLFIFLKITEPIHLGVIALLWVQLVLAVPPVKTPELFRVRKDSYYLILFLLPLAMMAVRVYRKNSDNREQHRRFTCLVKDLRDHEGQLFIATDDALPLDYFYIWDSPAGHRITNLLYKDRVITRSYRGTLQRFGIGDPLKAIYDDPRVFLLGHALPELTSYFRERFGVQTGLTPSLSGFGCSEVRKAYVLPRDSSLNPLIRDEHR